MAVAAGLIGRRHQVDFVLREPVTSYPAEVPSAARVFVLGQARHVRGDDNLTTLSGYIPLTGTPKVGIGWPRDQLRMLNATKWQPWMFLSKPRLSRRPGVLDGRVRSAWLIATYIKEQRPDCILAVLSNAKISCLMAAGLTSAPPIVPVVCNDLAGRSVLDRYRYRLLFSRACFIIAKSEGVANSLTRLAAVPSKKIVTIYNPFAISRIQALMTKNPDHPWMLDGGPPIVLAVGRLVPAKDYPTLLRAFARVISHRRLRLIILGDGPLRPILRTIAGELGIGYAVDLPGWTTNPFAYMARAALFVLSSRFEGLPAVLIEALACGCPCVSTQCSGADEILKNGRLGRLVPVGNHAALADAMERILDDPPEKPALRAAAARFSAKTSIQSYHDLITAIVRRRSNVTKTA